MNIVNLFGKKRGTPLLDSTDKSGIKSMILKPISMVLSFIYTPLLLGYLGNEMYGLWATILSIISWINYCDVGIGHGLRNLLTRELATKSYEDTRKSVSTAYIILTGISLVILVVLILLTFTLDWFKIFNTRFDMRLPLFVSFLFIVVNFILALCNTLLYAMQMSEKVALRGCIVQLLNIVGVLLFDAFTESNLVYMSILFGVTTMVVHLYNSFNLFLKYHYIRPSLGFFEKSKVKLICNTGIKFFLIQLSCMLLYTVDSILITHYFGSAEVTPFHIVDKAFNMGFSVISALMVPYWSSTTKALAEGDFLWVKKSLKKMYTVYCIFAIMYILLAIVFKPLAGLWIGRELQYQTGLVPVMCVYYLIFTFVTINTPFINGTGKINFQLVISLFMGIANVPLSIFLGVKCGLGVLGIRLATTILVSVAAITYPINLKHILSKLDTKSRT